MTRAWIIGNGPSLTTAQLDLLKNEVCFASNRIHLIYKSTAWKPKHYIRSEEPDGYNVDEVYKDIGEAFKLGITVWMPRNFNDGTLHGMRKHMLPSSVENYFLQCQHEEPPTEWHLPRPCTYGTVTSVAMQLAVVLGFTEIYLVGVDFDYVDGRSNHFSTDYETGHEAPADAVLRRHYQAYENAKRSCPVPIVNCTVGGKLELFPRMTIEEVLSGKRLQPGQGSAPGSQLDGSQGDPGSELQGSPDSEGRPEVRQGRRVQGKRSGTGE